MTVKNSKGSKIKATFGDRVFESVIAIILVIIGICMLFPIVNLLAKSFSSDAAVNRGKVVLWPVDFQLGTYQYIIKEAQFQRSFLNSLFITIVGTGLAIIVNCMVAYPLSKPWLKGRKGLMVFFVFVMLFSGGMIPTYLLMKSINLINNIWVLILPAILSVYNMILLKNFFEEIPESIEESAEIDGAGNIMILIKIVLPMSLPALATIGLFYAVSFWNNYMSGVLYITKPALKPLQQYLYDIVTEAMRIDDNTAMDVAMNAATNTESLQAATIMLSSIPIMLVYPFLQKHFVQGLRVGSIKG